MAASDVDDGLVGREVVGPDHRVDDELRHVRHRVVEDGGELGLLGQKVPPVHSAEVERHSFAGPDGVDEVAPVLAVLRCPDHARHPRDREGCIRPQRLTESIERVTAVAPLHEDALADQCPHQACQSVGVGLDAAGQLGDGQRAVGQRIGDPQLGRGGDTLCDPCAEDHVEHRRRGGCAAPMNPADDMPGPFDDADELGVRHLLLGHRSTLS